MLLNINYGEIPICLKDIVIIYKGFIKYGFLISDILQSYTRKIKNILYNNNCIKIIISGN